VWTGAGSRAAADCRSAEPVGSPEWLGLRGRRDDLWRLVRQGRKDAVLPLCRILGYTADHEGLWELVRHDAGRRADQPGYREAHFLLARILAARAAVDELAELAGMDPGHLCGIDRGWGISARGRLATLLFASGDLDGLQRRADRGETEADLMLIEALHARRDAVALRAEVHRGSTRAVEKLLITTVGSLPRAGNYCLTPEAMPALLASTG
jgi:hypothetical protein